MKVALNLKEEIEREEEKTDTHKPRSRSHNHTPFEQSGEVVLVDAFLSDHAEMGGKQRQSNGQQVRFTAQTVPEHPASDQAHQMNLPDQPDACHDPSLTSV